jgi:hypothetical protein
MANFQLNEDDSSSIKRRNAQKKPGLSGMLINWGLAKNESQANLYMIVIAVICIAIIIYQNIG